MNHKIDSVKQHQELDLFLSFRVTKDSRIAPLALNVQKIKEIVEVEQVTNLPRTYFPFEAVIDYRSVPIPVLAVEDFFSLSDKQSEKCLLPTKESDQVRFVICDVQGYYLALKCYGHQKMLVQEEIDYLPAPSVFQSIDKQYINGMLRTKGDQIIYVLDIESILDQYDLNQVSDKPTSNSHFPDKTVLIVEDSRLFQKKGQTLFSRLGFKVILAQHGREAQEWLLENDFKVDLVFTDLEMPIMDGVAFTRWLKQQGEAIDIPVLINSSLSNPALIQDIEREQLGRYIVKFDEDLIIKNLQDLLSDYAA